MDPEQPKINHIKEDITALSAKAMRELAEFLHDEIIRRSGGLSAEDREIFLAMLVQLTDGVADTDLSQQQILGLLEAARQEGYVEGARNNQHAILSILGHDAKHEAMTIQRILDTGWEGASVAAGRFAASLAGRMSCYSRFAVVSQKKAYESKIRDLQYDVSNCSSSVSIQDLFYGEFDAIVARNLAEQNTSDDFKALFHSLFGHISRQAALDALKARHLSVDYKGPDINLPGSVKNQDPVLLSCLRLVFSELLRNVAQHHWGYTLIPIKEDRERKIELTASIVDDFVQLDLRFAPFFQNYVYQDSSFVGLTSIRAALETCVGKAITKKPMDEVGEVLVPEFKDGCGVISFSVPSLGFIKQ